MDMHTHLMSQHSKDSYTERFFMDQADYACVRRSMPGPRSWRIHHRARPRRQRREFHRAPQSDQSRLDPGPRIFTSGKSLATTGGHADPTNALRGDYRRDAGPLEGVINGPTTPAKAVRQRYKDGADLIKLPRLEAC